MREKNKGIVIHAKIYKSYHLGSQVENIPDTKEEFKIKEKKF